MKYELLGLLHGGGDALAIGLASEIDKEVGQGEEIANVDEDSKTLTGGVHAVGDKEIADSERHAEEELGDLDGGQVALARGVQANGSGGVVTVHDGMDKGVEEDKDPDRSGLVADTGPHGEHRTRVVVGLEEGRAATLEEDDGGINDLVEL